jgi:hypothetical protein|tara:strand:- start:368 stop:580 length:213 start_codon:yes stop_codon:yes gene_type:complete
MGYISLTAVVKPHSIHKLITAWCSFLLRRMTMPQYQRREVQDWLNLFEQQKQSGLTAVEFCRRQQINAQT